MFLRLMILAASMPCLVSAGCNDGGVRPSRPEAAERGEAGARPVDAALAGASPASPDGPAEEVLPDALLINGDRVQVDEVLRAVRPQLQELAKTSTPDMYFRGLQERVKAEIMREVETVLLLQAAGIDVEDERVSESLNRVVDQELKSRINQDYDGRYSRFEAHLRSEKRTLREVREELRRRIIIRSYLRESILPRISSPTRRELLEFYNANIDDFTVESWHELFLIDIPFGDDREAARSSAQAAAHRILEDQPFEQVAREMSSGIQKDDGGSWGKIRSRMRGRYAVVSDVLFGLQEGQVSGIVEGRDAFFIVKAGAVQEASTMAFTEVQVQLAERYRAAQFETRRRRLLQTMLESAVTEPNEGLFLQACIEAAPTYAELVEKATELNERP